MEDGLSIPETGDTNDHGLPSVIQASNFSVSYGTHCALKSVSLRVSGRGIHALMGPSGCGKSTFLMSVAGLLPTAAKGQMIVRSGELTVKPECFAPRPNRLRPIGVVFQKPMPFRMSVFDNIALVLREHGVAKSERSDRVEKALRDAGLWREVENGLQRPAVALSGGQQQRLCLARTLALNPCLLLLDEPCSSLDPIATAEIEATFRELSEERCVLLVTHNLGQARRLAHDVSLFWPQTGGAICAESGSAAHFFESPQSECGRRYIEAEWGVKLGDTGAVT
jgi:phosphate transport system ATP-binding protein